MDLEPRATAFACRSRSVSPSPTSCQPPSSEGGTGNKRVDFDQCISLMHHSLAEAIRLRKLLESGAARDSSRAADCLLGLPVASQFGFRGLEHVLSLRRALGISRLRLQAFRCRRFALLTACRIRSADGFLPQTLWGVSTLRRKISSSCARSKACCFSIRRLCD